MIYEIQKVYDKRKLILRNNIDNLLYNKKEILESNIKEKNLIIGTVFF